MKLHTPFVLLMIFALIIKLCVLLYVIGDNKSFAIQQDNYATYARALYDGTLHTLAFNQSDLRLFPGYPVVILLLMPLFQNEIAIGLFLTLIFYIGAGILFWNVTKNIYLLGVFLFFPPIWLSVSSKVATEPFVVFLLLLTFFLYLRKKYYLSGFMLGIAFDVRLIAICLLASLLMQKNTVDEKKQLLFGFSITASLLFIYNIWQFGIQNIFFQFFLYPKEGKGTIGIIQIVLDIFRTLDWRQYHIFVSGVLYLLFALVGLYFLYIVRKKSTVYSICFWWTFVSLLFIFAIGPTPLLEEFGRFIVPFSSALLIGFNSRINIKLLI